MKNLMGIMHYGRKLAVLVLAAAAGAGAHALWTSTGAPAHARGHARACTAATRPVYDQAQVATQAPPLWPELDATARLRRALAVSDYDERETLLAEVVAGLAPGDFEKAFSFCANLPPSQRRSDLLSDVLTAWAAVDSERAASRTLDLPPSPVRDDLLLDVVDVWLEHDVDAAVGFAQELPEGSAKQLALGTAIAALANEEPERAWELACNMSQVGIPSADIAETVLAAWATRDPQAAAAAFLQLPPGESRASALTAVADSFAAESPEQAYVWARSLKGEERADALDAVIGEMATRDPAAAAKLAEEEGNNTNLLNTVASEWAAHAPAAAFDWAMELDVADRDVVLNEVLANAARHNPKEALRLLDSLPAHEQREALGGVLSGWAELDPAAAGRWALAHGTGEERQAAIEAVADSWASADPEAAASALDEIGPGFGRDALVSQLAWFWSDNDPARAVSWAEQLSSEDERESALAVAVGAWNDSDPQAASRWVRSLRDSQGRNEILLDLAQGSADLLAGARWAAFIDDPELRQDGIYAVADNWYGDANEARLLLTRAHLPEELVEAVVAAVGKNEGDEDDLGDDSYVFVE